VRAALSQFHLSVHIVMMGGSIQAIKVRERECSFFRLSTKLAEFNDKAAFLTRNPKLNDGGLGGAVILVV
jgi:hypothetical protein